MSDALKPVVTPLAPTDFLTRSATVHADRTAVEAAGSSLTYAELAGRAARAAGMLVDLGLRPGGRVSVLAPNSLAMLEAHFAVPWAGGVLNALNTRLSAAELRYILEHAGTSVLIVDRSLRRLAEEAAKELVTPPLLLVAGDDSEYEQLVSQATELRTDVPDETDMIALNYTSGTTGRPKGVMYSHRGAYLQSMAMVMHLGVTARSSYLWTLPMFHCNGWTFPWAITAAGGRHVLLERPDPEAIWQALEGGVTHLCAAPTVLNRLAAFAEGRRLEHAVTVATGGAPPSPALLGTLGALGIEVVHVYGLTETHGPAAICDWRPEWDTLPAEERAGLKARQGVANVISQPLRVRASGRDVPADGTTVGEIQFRGNNVMLGYYKDPGATAAAHDGEWFRTGDLGVLHQDGYVEIRDREKDVIISGGENITSIEVEQALDSHPAVLESAVVGVPDPEWGEAVIAHVALRPGGSATEAELIAHVKQRIARFKAPQRVVFGDLPKTATGKIQKFKLRACAQDDDSSEPNESDRQHGET
ncbi:AMP-binding protein [Nocardioides sp. CPCC 206347]|uniref:AMP-binding protein n=1 Tax=unclassified Nocardioides TaxID=2615069 RepID=UPI00360BCD96